jgi:hypothetical protein
MNRAPHRFEHALQPARRRLLGLAAALALGAALPFAPAAQAHTPAEYGPLIDLAGSQRMLTQRIVKAYCQIGLGVSRDVAREQLRDSVQRFDVQLAELRTQLDDGEARQALARVEKPWRGFRRLATGPVSRKAATRLSRLGDEVLQASHALVLALQDAAGTQAARLVNVAGRERMLAQRLAKLYMMRAWGVDTSEVRDAMESVSNEFAGALETLRNAEVNTTEILAELDAVTLQWEWFRSALTLQGTESYAFIVADASESILNSMEVVTRHYAALTGRA